MPWGVSGEKKPRQRGIPKSSEPPFIRMIEVVDIERIEEELFVPSQWYELSSPLSSSSSFLD